jgi:hypothetical protein
VAVSGSHAWVVDRGDGLRVIDVSTPSNPVEVGHYLSSGTAWAVAASGTIAFLADGTEGLRIIDISTPSSPGEIGSYNTPGFAMHVTVSDGIAYVADDLGLEVIDVSTPSSPFALGSYEEFDTLATAAGSDYVLVAHQYSGLSVFYDCHLVFADGFESGTTASWSATMPSLYPRGDIVLPGD